MNETPNDYDTPRKTGLHHRIYPYMDHLVQYASETADPLTDPDSEPWIVRDRSTALRNERTGRGRALVRTWIPGSWEYVNDYEEGEA